MPDAPEIQSPTSFAGSIKDLARNPLGIIAIFIVLVYAFASIVAGGATDKFYASPGHPAILFLAIFPVLVLFTFYKLVTRYHLNLYAPGDFKEDKTFAELAGRPAPETLARSREDIEVPKAVIPGDVSGVDKDLVANLTVEARIEDKVGVIERDLTREYEKYCLDGFVILHAAKIVSPPSGMSHGLYQVRVWIEAIEPEKHKLTEIDSVSYGLWHDFKKNVVTTQAEKEDFNIWLTIYGEFPVLATLLMKDNRQIKLQRYLDLPGRPPD